VAGVLDYATTIYLARQRGRLMHEAGLKSPGSMSAVLGMPEAALIDICRETGAVIANYNSPEQLVISGTKENVARASELAKSRGAVKVVPLQVSGAFHSPLMKPAVEGLTEIIHKINFNKPSISIIANVTAQPLSTPEAIKTELLDQLCNGVKWKNSVEYMLGHGVSTFIEIGPGKVLTGLIKRIDKNVNTINISDMTSAKNFALGKAV
jgi:[acyl-carrier-protein] S-malonyltransferase